MRRGFIALFTGSLVGKVFGIIREMLLAALFGTSAPVAAIRVAQTGTLVPINFFTADALSIGFLPNHSRLLHADPRAASAFYTAVSRLVLGFSLLAFFFLVFFREFWVGVLAPGLDTTTMGLAAQMLAVMAVSAPFYVHANIASYLEISHGSHLLATIRPAIQSIGMILGTVLSYLAGQPLYLALGFTSAYVFLSVLAVFHIHRHGYLEAGKAAAFEKDELRSARSLFFRTMLPAFWLPVIYQSAWVAERALSSLVSTETVAAIDYARLISDTALVLISAPLGLVILSTLSSGDHDYNQRILAAVGNRVLLATVPLASLLVLTAPALITIVFGRGAFGSESVSATSGILSGLSIGLWAQALSYTHIKALNAQRRNRRAVAVAAIGALVTALAQFSLVAPLGGFGLGLGVTIGAITQLMVSSAALRQFKPVGERLLQLLPLLVGGVFAVFLNPEDVFGQFLAGCAYVIAACIWVVSVPPLRADLLAVFKGQ